MSGENIEWNYRSVYTQKKKHNTTKKQQIKPCGKHCPWLITTIIYLNLKI